MRKGTWSDAVKRVRKNEIDQVPNRPGVCPCGSVRFSLSYLGGQLIRSCKVCGDKLAV